MTRVILDTGPLVALLSVQDARHAWAQETIGRLEPPLATCEAVITEACFLLRKTRRGVDTEACFLLRKRRGAASTGCSRW